jgi:hypothetical protein
LWLNCGSSQGFAAQVMQNGRAMARMQQGARESAEFFGFPRQTVLAPTPRNFDRFGTPFHAGLRGRQ